jgi:signal peptidase II
MRKYLILGITALVSIAADQYSKFLADHYLMNREPISYLHDFFVLTYSINHGAFLGLGSNLPENVRTIIFSLLVSIFLIGFSVYALREKKFTSLHHFGCALVISGGGSNLYDRITNNGGVTDFMLMSLGPLHTGIFNVADIAIMAGAILLVFYSGKKLNNNQSLL